MGILPDEEYNAVLTVLRLAEDSVIRGEEYVNSLNEVLVINAKSELRKQVEEERKRLKLAKELFVRFELIKEEDVK